MIGRLWRMLWSRGVNEAGADVRRSLGEFVASTQEVRRIAHDQVSAAYRVAPDYGRDRFARAVVEVTRRFREAGRHDP